MTYVKLYHGDNENVSTNLIWGTTWDNTLKFLVETGNKDYTDLMDSSSWGNYKDVSLEYIKLGETTSSIKSSGGTTLIPTGSTEYTKACNIYDLAGNVLEWSMELRYDMYRNLHGNSYQTENGYVSDEGGNDPKTSDAARRL